MVDLQVDPQNTATPDSFAGEAPPMPVGGDSARRWPWESLPRPPHPLRHPLPAALWLVEACFGVGCLLALLTVAAAIPVLNLLAFGYLLEAQGRVGRTGKLWQALSLLPAARRLGAILLATWLWLLPVQFLAGVAREAWVVAPATVTAWLWIVLLVAVATLVAAHLTLALARGGGWWCFFRPLKNARWFLARWEAGDYWGEAGQALWLFVSTLRLPHYFKLGLGGYAGTFACLLLPTLMYTSLYDATRWWQIALTLLGGASLALVVMWMPFVQAHFAAEGRWSAIWSFRAVLQRFGRAPFSCLLAAIVLFGLSALLPLYQAMIKSELPPHSVVWDVMLVAIVLTFPGRMLAGWAYHRGDRDGSTWRVWQWANGLVLITAVGCYLAFLMLAATAGELGHRVIWQHHALLLPLPWPF